MADGGRRQKRGGAWRAVERAWLEHPVYRSLPPSAQAAYTYLYVRCHPKWGLGLSSRELAASLGRDERTCRRLVLLLEEQGLLRIERTRGGAHRSCNRYWALPVPDGTPRPAWVERQASRAASGPTSSSSTSAPPVVVPRPTSPPAPALPAVGELAEGVLRLLAEHIAEDRHLGLDQALDEVRGYGAGTQRELADYYGLEVADRARPQLAGDTPEDRAAAMVVTYLAAWDLARAPLRRELELARAVVGHAGDRAWEVFAGAQRRLAALVRRGRVKAPLTFLYLLPHLEVEGALPPRTRPPEDVDDG